MARKTHARSQRAGRKDATERIRELIALLGSLARQGDSITIDGLSSRMGISHEEAVSLMDIVCEASGEESGGLLISMNDDETEFTLQYPSIHGRPLRLTGPETIAIVHALDLVGVEEGDSLRDRLRYAFSSPEVTEEVVRQALGTAWGDEWHAQHNALQVCAQAQVDAQSVVFLYRGMRDEKPRERHAEVLRIVSTNDGWHLDARDLDIDETRTFRVDRMTKVRLGDPLEEQSVIQPSSKTREVVLRFADKRYLTLFDWPGITVLQQVDGITVCQIPYYGPRSSWLPRRIVACGGSLTCDDPSVMQQAVHYAKGLT